MNAAHISEVQRDFSRAAGTYDAYAELQREVLAQAMQTLAPFLYEKTLLLDAGCGTGKTKELIPHGGILGIDIALPMCAAALRRGMSVANADLCRLPLTDASVDAVLCSLAMQWIPDRRNAFTEFFRVLRPGGHALVATFGEDTLQELRGLLANRVHTFPPLTVLAAEATNAGMQIMAQDSRSYVRHYDALESLMRSLKAIGAANKLPSRSRGLATAAIFRSAEALYRERYSDIHATWEVHYLLLRKP